MRTARTLGSATPSGRGRPLRQTEPDDAAARVAEIKAGDPTYSESFRSDSEGWEEQTNDDWQATRRLGRYRISVTPEQTVVWSTSPAVAADFLAEVDVAPRGRAA